MDTRTDLFASRPHEEKQYLLNIEEIIQTSDREENRTGIDTFVKYGVMMKFNLENGTVPLLTTKRVAHRTVIKELLWMISGNTDNNTLKRQNVHIWDDNSSEAFLKQKGLTYREGDLGPIYGFQWRHFNAEYKGADHDYTGEGFDQLAHVINEIKTNGQSRQIVMTAWNPLQIKEMALPPCHHTVHFNVSKHGLICTMIQRSGDMGLGVPFNIAFYSILTHMIAQVTDTTPYQFVHFINNAHVYENHVEPLKEQLTREPHTFPIIELNPSIKKIDDFRLQHIKIKNYTHHGVIKMSMAV